MLSISVHILGWELAPAASTVCWLPDFKQSLSGIRMEIQPRVQMLKHNGRFFFHFLNQIMERRVSKYEKICYLRNIDRENCHVTRDISQKWFQSSCIDYPAPSAIDNDKHCNGRSKTFMYLH